MVGGTLRAITEGECRSQAFRLTIGLVVGTPPLVVAGLLAKKELGVPGSPLWWFDPTSTPMTL
ncbi:MAG TPA: hypothetical protein V6D11_24345 [Waterburya sp.]